MSRLRPPDVGDRRHDPASLQAAAADLVLGGAPVGNPLQRYVGTAAVGPAWRHLQDRLASGAEASPRDDRSGSFASGRRGRSRPSRDSIPNEGSGSSIPPRPRRSLLRAPWKLLIGLQIRPGRGSSTQNISIHAPAGFGWRFRPTTPQLPSTRSSEETSNRGPR